MRSLLLLVLLAAAAPLHAQNAVEPDARYAAVAERLTAYLESQMALKRIPSAAIALVDDQRVVWARGFCRPRAPNCPQADTPFRVASVSKLFTDVAVMQLVEQGRLDLDAPLERYVPDAMPRNPFGTPVTLRQVLSHRAGIVREPPVGHYFDPAAPGLAAMARSLTATSLVYAPGTQTKYSNAAIGLAGYAIERSQGVPFAELMHRNLLGPLGITGSFAPDSALLARRARGTMWTSWGRTFDAPNFPLGIEPAGELSASMLDLSRFLSMLFANGQAQGGRVLTAATLASMWNVESGFGLGFVVGQLEGRRRVGHGGWHYGFGTELAALPNEKLGVAVSLTMDAANAAAERIANDALRLMLAAREGRALPAIESTTALTPAIRRSTVGRYRSATRDWEFWQLNDELWGWSLTSGFPSQFRARGDTLVADGLLRWGDRFLRHADYLVFGTDTLRRVRERPSADVPARWRSLVGEYGWDHDILYIHHFDGRLYALIEWFGLYSLEEVTPGEVYRFPNNGLYAGEEVRFLMEGNRPRAVSIAGVEFAWRRGGRPPFRN